MMFCCQIDIPLGNGKFCKKASFIGQCGAGCSYSFAKPGKQWLVLAFRTPKLCEEIHAKII